MTTVRLYEVTVSHSLAEARSEGFLSGFMGGRNRKLAQTVPPTSGDKEPDRVIALDRVTLEIRHGETMGILGPSGCGKTTLLRAIAGLQGLESGLITYDDEDVSKIPPGDRGIGIVFQNYALYPNMNSRENVGFFFRMHKRAREIPERVQYVSKVMGIGFEQLLDKRPLWLSGGQRQRVAMARCIARDPKLFLFDEPLSNVDPQLRTRTRGELKRLITRYKVTGIYVTHDQSEALALSDRIAIMNAGHIEQVGTAQYLLEHPISTMVATFLGMPPMNLFEGRLTETGWEGRDFSVDLPNRSMAPRSAVTLGVRAEHICLDVAGSLHGQVVLVEPLLADQALLVYIDLPHSRIVARFPQDVTVHRGDIITMSVLPENVHFFDSRTGKRL